MNYNIFSPKGRIDRATFAIYFILLMVLYFVLGCLFFFGFLKYNMSSISGTIVLFIINIFIMFNYKKRIMDFSNNLAISIILAIILTFDHILVAIFLQNNDILFYTLIVFVFCIQPAIIGLLPARAK